MDAKYFHNIANSANTSEKVLEFVVEQIKVISFDIESRKSNVKGSSLYRYELPNMGFSSPQLGSILDMICNHFIAFGYIINKDIESFNKSFSIINLMNPKTVENEIREIEEHIEKCAKQGYYSCILHDIGHSAYGNSKCCIYLFRNEFDKIRNHFLNFGFKFINLTHPALRKEEWKISWENI